MYILLFPCPTILSFPSSSLSSFPSSFSSSSFFNLFLSCIHHVFFLFLNRFLLLQPLPPQQLSYFLFFFLFLFILLLSYFLLLPASFNLELPLVHPLISLIPPSYSFPSSYYSSSSLSNPSFSSSYFFFLEIHLLPVPTPVAPHPSKSFLDSTYGPLPPPSIQLS